MTSDSLSPKKRGQTRSRSLRRKLLKEKYGLDWRYHEVTLASIERIKEGQRLGYGSLIAAEMHLKK